MQTLLKGARKYTINVCEGAVCVTTQVSDGSNLLQTGSMEYAI